MAAKIEVRNLTISFRTNNGAVRAVRDISFTLEQGETLAIAGESGSGKSVTTRAIMGISAPNAIVENGEIIYDGRDLLKIDEEDFHTLRGHKLSMVFQDPLSALNPVMRIGKQLTEAMVLNNKERRRDGRRNFNAMKKRLLANADDNGKALFDAFENDVCVNTPSLIACNDARVAASEMHMFIKDLRDELLKNSEKRVIVEAKDRLVDALENCENEHVLTAEEIAGYLTAMNAAASGQDDVDKEAINACLDKLEEKLNLVLSGEVPAFYEYDTAELKHFIAEAMSASAKKTLVNKKKALVTLRENRAVFENDPLKDRKSCLTAADQMSYAVGEAIDRLNLRKENASYVFASSMKSNIERYFTGVRQNPREEARFARDTKKHDMNVAKEKDAPEVVPKFTVDLEVTRGNMLNNIDTLIHAFEQAENNETDEELLERAEEMIEYLRTAYYDSAYKMPKWVAKNRAISLMKEVGIPEPYKRYHQYPFEFSGGMRQRIVIAIALSANPDVLICDEPTTALDVTIQAQILELINRLKAERHLTVIFITHDLGVVANMADKIAIMYAGKIVEYGTDEDVFYDPRHPYTWALLSSMPDLETKEKLEAIPGTPPDMIFPPKGDAFAERNRYALKIDFEEQPPRFVVSPTHWAATWLLHPDAPHVDPPAIVTERINRMKNKLYSNTDGKGQ